MTRLAIFAAAVVTAALGVGAQSVRTPQELRAALVGSATGEIELVGDDWRFGTNDVTELSFFISNHDQMPSHRVNLPIVGCTNLTLRGHGQTLRFDGRTIGAFVHRSENVRIVNLRFDWTSPALADAVIEEIKEGETVVSLDPVAFPHHFVPGGDGNYSIVSDFEGGSVRAWPWMLFSGKTHEIVERTADVTAFWSARLKPLTGNRFSIGLDCSKVGAGAKVGDIVCIRPGGRHFPAVVVDHAKDVALEDFVLYTASGMGLIAQMSENVSWRGTRPAAEKASGVFPPAGTRRVTTLHADATHFSNVKGSVVVENCWFETMMDDALNVHATCLSIVEKKAPNVIRCRYMHSGAYGFDVFGAGDVLRFIKGKTLENGAEVKVTSVARPDDWELVLTLAEPVPEEYGVGDAVENATYFPSVVFRGNVVRNNRARGILLTTPKPCRVEDNLFDCVSGAAILFAGDAQGWYESGACTDVTVRRNVFRNCLTSRFQFCEAIIASCPTIRDLTAQKVPYHRNIRITDNVFETFDVPLLYALSTEGIVWQRNRVERNADYQGWGQPAFRLEKSRFAVNDREGAAQARPRPFRCVYFTPADCEPCPDRFERLYRVMACVQDFYRREMARHGYGLMTFALEEWTPGRLWLYEVRGTKKQADYGRDSYYDVWGEVKAALRAEGLDADRERTIVFQRGLKWENGVAQEVSSYLGAGTDVWGLCTVYDDPLLDARNLFSKGPGGSYNGAPCSVGEFNTRYIGGIAHELGHTMTLPHDCETDDERQSLGRSLMGNGNHSFGRELRDEGRGTMLSAADALRLSAVSTVNGGEPVSRTNDVALAFAVERTGEGRLRVKGTVTAERPIRGLVVYVDPDDPADDYDALTWIVKPDAAGAFDQELTGVPAGGAEVRVWAVRDCDSVRLHESRLR